MFDDEHGARSRVPAGRRARRSESRSRQGAELAELNAQLEGAVMRVRWDLQAVCLHLGIAGRESD